MKFIASLLVLCLVLSLAPVQAQTDATGMDKTMIADKMSEDMDKMTVIIAGKVSGNVTYNMDEMAGMTGKTGDMNKNMTRKINGDMIVVKDISNKTENVVIIGKMDGMTKKVVIHGKMDSGDKMAGESENMNGMAEKMGNMNMDMDKAKDMDKKTVVVTGDINCNMAGKMVILGTMSDMKEMAAENEGMNGMAAENEGVNGMAESQAGPEGQEMNATAPPPGPAAPEGQEMNATAPPLGPAAPEGQEMNVTAPPPGPAAPEGQEMNATAGEMEKSVIATATIKYNMTGKMIIIGKMSDIKEMVAGYEKEGVKGDTTYKSENEDMKGVAAGKAGIAGYSNEDLTLIMTGVVRCKITGINLVVIGDMDKMVGSKAGSVGNKIGDMTTGTGMIGTEGQTNMMTYSGKQVQNQSDGQIQDQSYGQSQAGKMMTGESTGNKGCK